MPSLPAPEDTHIQHRQQQQVCAVLRGLACIFKSIHRKLGLRNSTRTTSFHRDSGAANVASCSATARLLVRPGHLESQFIAGADRIWSRGRELNSRPADYEMSRFGPSLLFSIFAAPSDSTSFAPFRQSSMQRIMHRVFVSSKGRVIIRARA